MKILFIYDNSVDLKALERFCDTAKTAEVDLLPLAGNSAITEKVKGVIDRKLRRGTCLDSVRLLDNELSVVRTTIAEWSARVGDHRIGAKTIKEWFVMPGSAISAWWFGPISEKNTLKTDLFYRLVQVRTAKRVLSAYAYDRCVIALSDRTMWDAVKAASGQCSIPVTTIRVIFRGSVKASLKRALEKLGLLGDIASGLYFVSGVFARGIAARIYLGPPKRRQRPASSLLFITYFPQVDKDMARGGVFRNRYASVLQDTLNELKIPTIWALMYVPMDGHSLHSALKMARNFVKKGTDLVFLEACLGFRHYMAIILTWIRQIAVGKYLFGRVSKSVLFANPFGRECEGLVRELWHASFFGPKSIDGMVHYAIFKEIFATTPTIEDCLYYCEMQPWEKALNAAKNAVAPLVRTIGFQHSSFSKNDFQYLYAASELERNGAVTDLPLPDILACGGEAAGSYFKDLGYGNIKRVEAIRYLYLNDLLSSGRPSRQADSQVVLVTGSAQKKESANLIAMVNAAFPKNERRQIWFKGHPTLPIRNLLREQGIDHEKAGYVMCDDDLSQCIKKACVVIVPTSTVALEALACGCEVVVPVFADSMLVNPLADFQGYYHRVESVRDLIDTLDRIAGGHRLHDVRQTEEFVRKYWCLDRALPRWKSLLTANRRSIPV